MSTITATSRDRLDSDDEGPSPVPGTDNTRQRPEGEATARAGAFEVRFDSAAGAADAAWLAARLADAAAVLGAALDQVVVTVVGDQRMRTLHRDWKGVDLTTDVLTFRHSAPGEPIEADIVVCADEARRRAAEFGHDARTELLLYALHGLLHCAGHDDATEAGYAAMHAEEDRILGAIGVGPAFHRPGGEARRA